MAGESSDMNMFKLSPRHRSSVVHATKLKVTVHTNGIDNHRLLPHQTLLNMAGESSDMNMFDPSSRHGSSGDHATEFPAIVFMSFHLMFHRVAWFSAQVCLDTVFCF